jgi:UDP-galactopyranose mutase
LVSSARFDWLVVGAGLAGCVMAERLARSGNQSVLVVDEREVIAGNAADAYNEAGLLYHCHGPHIFHTNSQPLFEYVSKFTKWLSYRHRVMTRVGRKHLPFPINSNTLNCLFGTSLSPSDMQALVSNRSEIVEKIKSSEDFILSQVGRELFNLFFENYTLKHWGIPASALDASVASRVPVRFDSNDDYFRHRYQGIPAMGYSELCRTMLDHKNIDVELGFRFQRRDHELLADNIVYSGAIDDYFEHAYGPLPYRHLTFRHRVLKTEKILPTGVMNYPGTQRFTRITEHKHLTGQQHPWTMLTFEYPGEQGVKAYPVPKPENKLLYRRYAILARQQRHVHFVGRLATYQYLDMDQVIGQALATFSRISRSHNVV